MSSTACISIVFFGRASFNLMALGNVLPAKAARVFEENFGLRLCLGLLMISVDVAVHIFAECMFMSTNSLQLLSITDFLLLYILGRHIWPCRQVDVDSSSAASSKLFKYIATRVFNKGSEAAVDKKDRDVIAK
ncbi:uncharacterized protein BX663DRAFT_547170 [Cokeromyces recurvatus]|uniref:uncharacterized protein n=1 Tax=Cokeromyces recurvatus TaxID=90255 RepID=UPI00221E6478|nr:uncharacterized protein BX663DRAFT_547170 [Cokeromyces recurvatus]KAI7907439.1 hypothetical protein BX663DRAFT_547170 [Cokeromyces recurvatus]